ncbi:protocadherin-9-like [Mytilus edulis]|uniref:protocadherin-9-like n=1 Tax=Mytilus edulis TaxID=6550 RepID=UPI0039EF1F43
MATIMVLSIIVLISVLTLCSSQNITFILQEDRPNSTLIGNILTESKLREKYSAEELTGITYDFYDIKDEHRHLFRLDPMSSHLYTNAIIDREGVGICLYLEDCYFDFKILAHKKDIFHIIDIRVNVTDLNDNDPKFEPNELTLNISESTAQYSKFSIQGARDLDTGKGNGIASYSLTSQSGKDDLKLLEENIDGNKALYISVHNELDRERTPSYTLYLKAYDNGSPLRTGTLTIHVNIVDENDNKPLFSESEVNVNLDETSPAGTLVKHLTAVDIDSGKNGQVFYRLKSFQAKEINDSFTVDSLGKLTTAKKLEYEQNKVYTVIVEAVDRGNTPLSSQATVNVHVQDSGNNAPEVSVNFLSNERDGDAVLISEKSEIDVLVAVIKVKDMDSGDNGVVTCQTYSTYFGLSRISDTDFRLIVQHKLDRESTAIHNVTVTCKDKGLPEMDGSVHFQIILKDENDNPPRFSLYYYQVDLLENTPAGAPLLTVPATDIDAGDNGKITYAISPSSDLRFKVDPQTGEVTTNQLFDRETTARLTFEVVAKDHGVPPMESKAPVVVNIKDENDNKPQFVKMIFDFQVSENMPNGTNVEVVSAIDPDQGTNAQIVYSLDPNSDTSSIPFNVFTNGQVTTLKIFDREHRSHYDFPVIAVDKGTPSLTSTVTVRVTITDKNDNKPIFTFPKNANNTIQIPNTLPVDSIIATIQAYDLDYEENGKVNFFILSGDDENLFYLNPSTGSLHVKKVSNTVRDKNFRLKIEAKDRGRPSLNETAELKISILYVNATSEESKEYILIVVCVVCVTFVVAVALIAVICFLRNKNIACGKNERYLENNRPPQYDQVQAHPKNFQFNDKNNQRVKVGTTFTKEEMMGTLTLSHKDSPRKGKDDSNYNYDRQMPQKVPDESETSSKTDSGHGSEEDYNQQLDKNGRPFALNNQTYNNTGIYVMLDKNKSNNTDIARGNMLPPMRDKSNKYLDDSVLTGSMNSMWSENPSSSRHPSNSQTSAISPSWTNDMKLNFQNNSPFYMALGSIQSRDDDECTTTSGSYTINPDELDDEFENRPKDLFV